MRKLKILLPSIALMVVLAFSITIGVYAASQVSFTVSSTISFQSPDLAAEIKCYVGDVNNSENLKWTWINYTETNSTITIDESYAHDWSIDTKDLTFKTTPGSGDVEDIVLNFVITNKTEGLPAYAYFASTSDTNKAKVDSATLNGTKNEGLISITFTNATVNANGTQTISARIHLNKNIKDADTAAFEYTLVLSKLAPAAAA